MVATSPTRRSIVVGVGLAQLEAEGEVVPHAQVGVERVRLEHHGDVALAGSHAGDVALAEHDRAAGDLFEAGEQAQQGRLAAAARADEHREGAVGDLDVDAHAAPAWCRSS
jgi:hypothetical protein